MTGSEDPKTLSAPNRHHNAARERAPAVRSSQVLFEPKWDGFRALEYMEQDQCGLVSHKGHGYKAWVRHRCQVGGGSRTSWLKVRNPDYAQCERCAVIVESTCDK